MLMLKIKKYSIGLLVYFSIGFLSYFSQLPNAYAGIFINMATPNFAFSIGTGLNAYYTPSVPGYVYYYGYNSMYYMWYNGVLMYAPYYSGPWLPVYRGMIIPRIFLSGPPAPPPNFRWGHWGPPPGPPPRGYYNQYRGYVHGPEFHREGPIDHGPEFHREGPIDHGPQGQYQRQGFRPQAQIQRPMGTPNQQQPQFQRQGPIDHGPQGQYQHQGFRPQAQIQRPMGTPNQQRPQFQRQGPIAHGPQGHVGTPNQQRPQGGKVNRPAPKGPYGSNGQFNR